MWFLAVLKLFEVACLILPVSACKTCWNISIGFIVHQISLNKCQTASVQKLAITHHNTPNVVEHQSASYVAVECGLYVNSISYSILSKDTSALQQLFSVIILSVKHWMQPGKESPNGDGPCASTAMKRHPKLSRDDSVKAAHNIYTFGHPCARNSNELQQTGFSQVPLPTMQLHRLNTSTIRCYQNTFTFICSTRPNETNGSSLVFLGPGKHA